MAVFEYAINIAKRFCWSCIMRQFVSKMVGRNNMQFRELAKFSRYCRRDKVIIII